jgi:hypothetical protein
MFRRRWRWFGKLVSGEGFSLAYGHKSITYTDQRGSFEFGFEDGLLFPNAVQVAGTPVSLQPNELQEMLERIARGIESEGHSVKTVQG